MNGIVFNDAQTALPFVIQQGRNIETVVFEQRYPTYDYAIAVPVVTEGAPWAIGTTFFSVDTVGEADWISGNANDIPFVENTRDQHSHDFGMLASGWRWTLEEVNQASLYMAGLSPDKALTARRVVEEKLYNIAMTGDTKKRWTGLINSTDVPRADAAATGTGSRTYWADKSVDQILTDINNNLTGIRTRTLEVEWGDTIGLPPDAFRIAATRRLGAGDGNMTLLEYIRKGNIYTAETGQALGILSMRSLAKASQDGGGRMIAYRKARDVVRFHLPLPYQQLEARKRDLLSFEQAGIARTGGTEWRLPLAAAYLDEITPPPA